MHEHFLVWRVMRCHRANARAAALLAPALLSPMGAYRCTTALLALALLPSVGADGRAAALLAVALFSPMLALRAPSSRRVIDPHNSLSEDGRHNSATTRVAISRDSSRYHRAPVLIGMSEGHSGRGVARRCHIFSLFFMLAASAPWLDLFATSTIWRPGRVSVPIKLPVFNALPGGIFGIFRVFRLLSLGREYSTLHNGEETPGRTGGVDDGNEVCARREGPSSQCRCADAMCHARLNDQG